MNTTLAYRLSVHVLKDLSTNAPTTLLAVDHWLQHVGFWLHDLNKHDSSRRQVSFMVDLLSLAMARDAGWDRDEARRTIKEYVAYQQIKEQIH